MCALIAGPCTSEMGWECLEWQGYVRKCAAGLDGKHVVVCSSSSMEPLYADMQPIFVGHKIEGERDCHKLRNGKKYARALAEIECILGQKAAEFTRQGITVQRIRSCTPKLRRHKLCDQVFVKYGRNTGDKYKLVIHARNHKPVTPFTGDNYPPRLWNLLIEKLQRRVGAVSIAAIGTKKAALSLPGAADCRDIPLSATMDLMASAHLVIGPSSGPMHLASLCGTPHVVWCTDRKQPAISGTNYMRYTREWNPFDTPVEVVLHRKGVPPSPEQLVEAIVRMWKRSH